MTGFFFSGCKYVELTDAPTPEPTFVYDDDDEDDEGLLDYDPHAELDR